MSKQRAIYVASVLFLAAASPALAQRPEGRGARGPGGGQGMMLMNPVANLMQQDELGLTDQQKEAFQVLADELDEANAPDREQVQEAMAAARSGGGRGAMQEMRPLMQKIQERNTEALNKAKELLTDEQKVVADQLIEEMQAQGRGRGRRGGGGSGGA